MIVPILYSKTIGRRKKDVSEKLGFAVFVLMISLAPFILIGVDFCAFQASTGTQSSIRYSTPREWIDSGKPTQIDSKFTAKDLSSQCASDPGRFAIQEQPTLRWVRLLAFLAGLALLLKAIADSAGARERRTFQEVEATGFSYFIRSLNHGDDDIKLSEMRDKNGVEIDKKIGKMLSENKSEEEIADYFYVSISSVKERLGNKGEQQRRIAKTEENVPEFLETIESQIRSKDINIIDTLLKKSEVFRTGVFVDNHWLDSKTHSKIIVTYRYEPHENHHIDYFFNALFELALTGKTDSYSSSDLLKLTMEETTHDLFKAKEKLKEQMQATQFPEASEKLLNDVMKAFNESLKRKKLFTGFPPRSRILRGYAYPECTDLPNFNYDYPLDKVTSLFDDLLEDKDKVLLDIEKGRKNQLAISLKRLDKIRSKTKITAVNADDYFTASMLYLLESDLSERLKAKALLEEFIGKAEGASQTPKMKTAIEKAEEWLEKAQNKFS